MIGGRLNFEASLPETSVGDCCLNSQVVFLLKESLLPAYTLTYLDDGENFSPRPVAMKRSSTPPQRIVTTRKQLDTSQLHS
jgi:hypothetical protein